MIIKMFNLSNLSQNKNKFLIAGIVILTLLASLLIFYKPKPPVQPSTSQAGQKGLPSLPPPLLERPATPSGQISAQKQTDENEVNKLKDKLPFTTEHFSIRYDVSTKILAVTLYPILNRPDPQDIAKYDADLKIYRQEFLDWLKANHADPEKIAIVYFPNPDNPTQR